MSKGSPCAKCGKQKDGYATYCNACLLKVYPKR